MAVRHDIVFDDHAAFRKDEVTAVLVPADRYTRMVVSSGVTASLWDTTREGELPDRIVRNLSGHLVLLNRPRDTPYTFRIDPRAAGYVGPFNVPFEPKDDERTRIVWLHPRPDQVFDPGTTLIRGVVVRDDDAAQPAGDIRVVATPDQPDAGEYETTTDARGAFVVPVRLAPVALGDDPQPVRTTLALAAADGPARDPFDVALDRGREHVFSAPLDLDGDDVPPFTHEGET